MEGAAGRLPWDLRWSPPPVTTSFPSQAFSLQGAVLQFGKYYVCLSLPLWLQAAALFTFPGLGPGPHFMPFSSPQTYPVLQTDPGRCQPSVIPC